MTCTEDKDLTCEDRKLIDLIYNYVPPPIKHFSIDDEESMLNFTPPPSPPYNELQINNINRNFLKIIKTPKVIDTFNYIINTLQSHVLLSRSNLQELILRVNAIDYPIINVIYIGNVAITHKGKNIVKNTLINIDVNKTKEDKHAADDICCHVEGIDDTGESYCDYEITWNEGHTVTGASPVFEFIGAGNLTTTDFRQSLGGKKLNKRTKKHHLRRGRRCQSSRRHKKVVVRKSRRF